MGDLLLGLLVTIMQGGFCCHGTMNNYLMAKRNVFWCWHVKELVAQFDSRPLTVGNRPLSDLQIESAICCWKDLDAGYKFGLDLVVIRIRSRELWAPKVPGLHPGQFRDNFGTPTRESREKNDIRAWVPRSVTEYTIGSKVVAYSRVRAVVCLVVQSARGLSQHPRVSRNVN